MRKEYMIGLKQRGIIFNSLLTFLCVTSAFFIPSYTDYTYRSRIVEGFVLASGTKAATAEYYAAYGVWPSSNQQLGMAEPQKIHGRWVSSVAVGDGGVITITYNNKLPAAALITLTPQVRNDMFLWTCQRGANMKRTWAPAECQ